MRSKLFLIIRALVLICLSTAFAGAEPAAGSAGTNITVQPASTTPAAGDAASRD